jgi:methyl-accepting chemotaxis protein
VVAFSQSQADLTRRSPVTSHDDLGDIAGGINQFVANLQSLLKEISFGTKEISISIGKLCQQTNANIDVLQQHVMESELVVTAVEGMSATALAMVKNTSQASNASLFASQQVNDTVSTPSTITVAASSLVRVIPLISATSPVAISLSK